MIRPGPTLPVVGAIVWAAACAEPNQAPFACGPISTQTVDIGDSVSFSPCFTDPDADPLTISAEVAHHLKVYADVSVSGETVTIHGKHEYGLLPATVTATDPSGLYAVEGVEVAIRGLHDLAVTEAWPDSQTVTDGEFELHFRYANVGESIARLSEWTVHMSNDPVITADDPVVPGAYRSIVRDMAPGGNGYRRDTFGGYSDPGVPYFGLCGVSHTPEYNLENNCSTALKVIFPDSMAPQAGKPSHVSTVIRDSTPPPPPGGPVP